MSKPWQGMLAFIVTISALACHTTKRYDTNVPIVEEFNPPPNEDRFNYAPESSYKKPPPKKDVNIRQAIGPGGPGQGGAGFGAPPSAGGGFGRP